MPNDMFGLRFSQPRMAAGGTEAEIMLYGEIIHDMPKGWKWSEEDKSAAEFDKALKQARADGAEKLLLRINSPGGYVAQAMAMRSSLAQAGFTEMTIRIEGLCASAATIIACVNGAKVQIAPGSEYMIHNPINYVYGQAADMEKEAEHLRAEEQTARNFYAEKTGQSDEQIKEWMDKTTWFTAEDAVKYGFCDELLSEAKGAGLSVACATAEAMRGLYGELPAMIAVQETPEEEVSHDEPTVAAGAPSEHNNTNTNEPEEDTEMEMNELTREQLEQGNPDLLRSITEAAMAAERQRVAEIDELTLPGYEQMAADAKANGTSAMDFHKALIKAQKDKAKAYMPARQEETKPANEVTGGAADEPKDVDEAEALAKELAGMASAMKNENETMF